VRKKPPSLAGTTVAMQRGMADLLPVFTLSLAIDLGRYLLVAVPAFFIFWAWLGPRFRQRWLRPAPPDAATSRREIAYSIATATLFAVTGVLVHAGTQAGIFHVYRDVSLHGGLLYALVTPLILIVLQDTYFYFTHRAMHHRLLFRTMHRVHHLSKHTSPLTAYAFHPLEALVHAAFVPLVALVLPVHEISVFAFLGFMIVRNVVGHLGMELYPSGFTRNPLGRVQTTTTHHALHHLRPGSNFGLYFTFWDRLLGTTDATYEDRFEAVARGDRA
jgi:Delta7-sterol 5-desaturase